MFIKQGKEFRMSHVSERNVMNMKLECELSRLRKDNENAIAKAQIESTNVISRLAENNRQQTEKLIREKEENVKNLEIEFREKERILTESFKHLEEQDREWKIEREEVFHEMQKLKDEARKMVNLLAMEYEKDPISEKKKMSLTQEVYSLQLVVEMRTGEVRNLREQLAKTSQQLEEALIEKDKQRNVTARIEDLEEQLRRKTELMNLF